MNDSRATTDQPNAAIRTAVLVARNKRGIRQQDMADELAVSRVTIINWETGRSVPSLEILQGLRYHKAQWVSDLAETILAIMFPAREAT